MTHSDPPAIDGVPDLGYLLRQAAGLHRYKIDRALADIGATAPQFLILTLIAGHPGCSGADLARMAVLTTPTVSQIVATLVLSGCVSRLAHATHGRKQQLRLTDAGTALLGACKHRAAPIEADLAADLPGSDIALLRAWLTRIGPGTPGRDEPPDAENV